jgi:hypothetical protein
MARTTTRARRRAVATLGLVAALTGGACADSADGPDVAAIGGDVGEFAATSEYLSGVARATDGLSYRLSGDMTMRVEDGGDELEMGGAFLTGEVDGDLSSTTLDMAALSADMARQDPGGSSVEDDLLEADLTMEMVTDGTTLYLRAPLYASMADLALDSGASADDLGPVADLAKLDDKWGRVDISRLSPTEVARAAGAQSSDPRAFLDMAALGSDVRDLGTETIDGVESRGLGATITYGDMLEVQGMDADAVRDSLGASRSPGGEIPEEIFDDMVESVLAMDVPIEVWVDDDDRVRRISLVIDMTETILAAAEAAGEDPGVGTLAMTMVLDFSDYGDDTIEIEVPTDAVDVTDEYLAFIEGGGLRASSVGRT